MKKLLFILSAGAFCFFTSCSSKNEGGMSDKAKKNLESSHAVNKAFETGDISGIDNAIASDFVDHTDRGDMGRDSLKAMITMMHATMKDMKMGVIKELADDDYVFSHMRFTGTSDGSMGMPKGPYDMQAIEVVKFKDGKGVEHWTFMQVSDMMKMMGNPQNSMPMTDTAKKMENKM